MSIHPSTSIEISDLRRKKNPIRYTNDPAMRIDELAAILSQEWIDKSLPINIIADGEAVGVIDAFFGDNGELCLEIPDRTPWHGKAWIEPEGEEYRVFLARKVEQILAVPVIVRANSWQEARELAKDIHEENPADNHEWENIKEEWKDSRTKIMTGRE